LTSTPSPLTTSPPTALFSPASWCDDNDDDVMPSMMVITLQCLLQNPSFLA
jgi:hypothetical protein